MVRNKKQTFRRDPLPENFKSLEEFWSFWDMHSTADYEDLMEDADLQISFDSNKIYYAIAKDLSASLRSQAKRQGVSAQTLINLWLREKVTQASKKRAKAA